MEDLQGAAVDEAADAGLYGGLQQDAGPPRGAVEEGALALAGVGGRKGGGTGGTRVDDGVHAAHGVAGAFGVVEIRVDDVDAGGFGSLAARGSGDLEVVFPGEPPEEDGAHAARTLGYKNPHVGNGSWGPPEARGRAAGGMRGKGCRQSELRLQRATYRRPGGAVKLVG